EIIANPLVPHGRFGVFRHFVQKKRVSAMPLRQATGQQNVPRGGRPETSEGQKVRGWGSAEGFPVRVGRRAARRNRKGKMMQGRGQKEGHTKRDTRKGDEPDERKNARPPPAPRNRELAPDRFEPVFHESGLPAQHVLQ